MTSSILSDSAQLARIAEALERLAPAKPDISALEDGTADAFLWQARSSSLLPVAMTGVTPLHLLHAVSRQAKEVLENTRYFASGHEANNVMLWGARGMGKSSLVKACLMEVNRAQRAHNRPTLALVEIPRDDLKTLPEFLALLRQGRIRRRIILFCDDLSFEAQDGDYKSLKSVLDGGISGRPENLVVYATSNRRHLMPREMIENETGSAIQPGEAVEEKISLSDRFGLWIGLYSATQEDYLAIVTSYAESRVLKIDKAELHRRALEWAMMRGSRSGRVAIQFITALTAELTSQDKEG